MKKILLLLAITTQLFIQSALAQEIAVLLPVTGPLTPHEKTVLTKEVVDGLATKYELKHGEQVELFVNKIFKEESNKTDCDEANCYRRIAAQYHAEKIVALRVVKVSKDGFLVTTHLYDVPTGTMIFSEKMDCAACTTQKLKTICKKLMTKLNQSE